MPTMKALRKSGPPLGVCQLAVPAAGPGEVLVRVAVAALCRTDVHVARGLVPAANPVVLGHEFAGTLAAVGAGVTGLRVGDRVAVVPVLPCRRCALCESDPINCPQRGMLGVDRDGAFAGFVAVPADLVCAIPDHLSFQHAACAEPVAAALAVLQADIQSGRRGLVLGRNRFSRLIEAVLHLHGFTDVTVGEPASGAYDFVVETGVGPVTLAAMLAAVRPRGTLVLRSRQPGTVALDLLTAVTKQVTLRAVNYGSFRRALVLLAEGALDLAELLGPVFALEQYADVFAQSEASESVKLFFDPWR
jgi:L-iditol 2-dehydrogenase